MRIPQEEQRSAGINIVPMIDIIFSILAYFIISTLYLTKSKGLPVNLPGANTAQQQPSTEITVTIDAAGDIFLNEALIEIATLRASIRNLMAETPETLIIINADKAVSHGAVVEVMDEVRQIEGARLAIAAQKETTPVSTD
ncbi:biopolymer transporter ExbD (plasmid) [Picosynechococcus sp. PCC 7003]|uniref:ExbD/TolR family protein n=1 Tax=Picosynechococcus sp. PCC 7003 TaxID=374981 RepID=UPI0008103F19|nr:biopolymer transporter ExbD [Picosynechococcus sp. PCC 7003]ANV85893.1 biopolymer transporter ExbD [Picosynechococcus sp. PCC 7003]